ncbi:MAG: ester cyclase [Candidatus Latescibacterota bacterium]
MEVIDQCYAEDYDFDAPALPGQPKPVGREAFKARVQAFGASFEKVRYDIEECIAEGDVVCTRFVFGGKHVKDFAGFPTTGRMARINGVHFARFENGLIQKTWAGFTNIAEQLGPRP